MVLSLVAVGTLSVGIIKNRVLQFPFISVILIKQVLEFAF